VLPAAFYLFPTSLRRIRTVPAATVGITLAGCGKRYLEGASHTAIATYDAPTLANITE
jgi:hypothetical protein